MHVDGSMPNAKRSSTRNRAEGPTRRWRSAAHRRRFLTFSFGRKFNGQPGLIHVTRCLGVLVALGALSNRTALLPPPAMLLSPGHNALPGRGAAELDAHVSWSRYYDLSSAIALGVVADPAHAPVVHRRPAEGYWHAPDGDHGQSWWKDRSLRGADLVPGATVHMPPQTPFSALRASSARVVNLEYEDGWGDGAWRYATDCAHAQVGGRDRASPAELNAARASEEVFERLAPSQAVLQTASSIAAALHRRVGRFVLVHVRRGDALQGSTRDSSYAHAGSASGSCGGLAVMRRATSPKGIARVWQQHFGAANATLVVMSNEPVGSDFFGKLRELLHGVRFARELPEVQHAMRGDDNYFSFEVLRHLGHHASARVGTSACYFVGGCELLLRDEEAAVCRRRAATVRGGARGRDESSPAGGRTARPSRR
jgi:hypothetical protein